MKKTVMYPLLVVLLFSFAGSGAAEEDKYWKSDLEFGFVQTSGNTHTRTLISKGTLLGEGESLRTSIEGSAINTSDQGTTTAEKYVASIQEDWKLSERDYIFSRFGFDTDRFGGFKRRLSETVGFGRDVVKLDDFVWKMEIGAGARQTTLIPEKKQNEVIGRSATSINWKLNDNVTFIQKVNTEGGKEGFVSNSVTALQSKLNGSLSSKITYSAKHTTKVPAGNKKLDTETAVTLVWSY